MTTSLPQPNCIALDTETTYDHAEGLLTKAGVGRYFADPDTQTRIICCVDAHGNEKEFNPDTEREHLIKVVKQAHKEGRYLLAHNAVFDRYAMEQVVPGIKQCNWTCSKSLANLLNLPARLKYAVVATGGKVPKGELPDPQAINRRDPLAIAYCMNDTRITLDLWNKLARLYAKSCKPTAPLEQVLQDITTHLRINERGVPVDVERVKIASERVADLKRLAQVAADKIIGGKAGSRKKKLEWFAARGINLPNTQRETVLKACMQLDTEEAKMLAYAFDIAGRTSMAKWEEMATRMHAGRLHDQFRFSAAFTGRFKSWGVQMHNFPRPDGDEELVPKDLDWSQASAHQLSRGLRTAVKAGAGKTLVVADYTQIEVRVLFWLAGEHKALELLKDPHQDIYKHTAAHIFRIPVEQVSKEHRRIGKSAVLGLGYGMGVEKFAHQYQVSKELAERAHAGYHSLYPGVKKYWKQLQPTRLFSDCFVLHTASGRPLLYWNVDGNKYHPIKDGERPGDLKKQWFGGKLAEHICSGTARDCIMDALNRMEAEGIEVVAHVHDEILAEVPLDQADRVAERMRDIMISPPAWATGLPLDTQPEVKERWQ